MPRAIVEEDTVTRVAAITPAHREHLRNLKADFDRAYAVIEDVTDRGSDSFRAAEALYRVWIKAIDARAMALLDDLDALDIGGGGPRPEPQPQDQARPHYSPVSPIRAGEVDHVFAEMDDILHARDLLGEEDEDALELISPAGYRPRSAR